MHEDDLSKIKMFGRTYSDAIRNPKQYKDFIKYNEDMETHGLQDIHDFGLNKQFYESTRDADLDMKLKKINLSKMLKPERPKGEASQLEVTSQEM